MSKVLAKETTPSELLANQGTYLSSFEQQRGSCQRSSLKKSIGHQSGDSPSRVSREFKFRNRADSLAPSGNDDEDQKIKKEAQTMEIV